jgi:hypothetical protein
LYLAILRVDEASAAVGKSPRFRLMEFINDVTRELIVFAGSTGLAITHPLL